MDTPLPKQLPEKPRFVAPSLRPSPEQPSRRRIYIGITLLFIGFIGIFLGGPGLVGQMLLIGGSTCVVGSLFAFGSLRFSSRHKDQPDDMHKLYGSKKT